MPILLIGSILLIIFVVILVIYFIKTEKVGNRERRGLNILIFVFSLISLIISLKLFWNMGVYADEYNASLVDASGGIFWRYMDWLRIGLLLIIFVISGLNLVRRSK